MMDKKGNLMQLPMMLLFLFMAVAFLVAIVPGLVDILDTAKQSDSLNCNGYVYDGNANHKLSYNATIGTKNTIGCLALTLYIPYIVLGVLIAGVAALFYSRRQDGGDQYQG